MARLAAVGAPPSALIGARHAVQARSDGGVGGRQSRHRGRHSGGRRVVRDRGVRVEPFAPHGHSSVVRRQLPARFWRRSARPDSAAHFGTRSGDQRDLPGIRDRSHDQWEDSGRSGGQCDSRPASRLDRRRSTTRVAPDRPWVQRQCGKSVPISGQSSTSPFRSSRQRRAVPFRVVSQVALPVLDGGVSLGTGAVFSTRGYEDAACSPGPSEARCRTSFERGGSIGILAAAVPGPRGQAAVTHYLNAYPSIAEPAVPPTSLINFGEAVNFPFIVAGIVAAFGAATMIHLLVVNVNRRRRELALLRVLGFVNRQIVLTVAWQATDGRLRRSIDRRASRDCSRSDDLARLRQSSRRRTGRRGGHPDHDDVGDRHLARGESARHRPRRGRAANRTGEVVAGGVAPLSRRSQVPPALS